MANGAIARPMAGVGRFVWGAFLGALGLLGVGLMVLALSWLGSALSRLWSADGSVGARRLAVSGQELSGAGAAVMTLRGNGLDLRLTCRGPCDDLALDPATEGSRARLMDGAGRCVACGHEVRWRRKPDGTAALVVRRIDGGAP